MDESLPDWRRRRDLLNAAPLGEEDWDSFEQPLVEVG